MINIGIVGRLTEIKNHQMFIDAAAILTWPENNNTLRFWIIGDGELYDTLYMRRSLMKEDLIFTGWQKDMAKVYKSLDIVVCTSNNEGTPVSLIEAAVCGLPIISTDVGGIRDIFKDSESILFVKKNDCGELAHVITVMVNDIEYYKEKAKEFKEVVYNRFRKERLIKDIKKLYNI